MRRTEGALVGQTKQNAGAVAACEEAVRMSPREARLPLIKADESGHERRQHPLPPRRMHPRTRTHEVSHTRRQASEHERTLGSTNHPEDVLETEQVPLLEVPVRQAGVSPTRQSPA